MRVALVSFLAGGVVIGASLDAKADYSEAVNGNFSSVNTAPTPVPVTTGSNLITGVVGGASADGQVDDYFEITVPTGRILSSIVLTNDVSSSGPNDQSFFAVASGGSISSSNSTATGMLGWVLFKASMVNTNLLPPMGTAGNGATGFSGPLPAGTYTFRVQDNDGGNSVNYQFNLVLSPTAAAPAISGWWSVALYAALALVGAGAFTHRPRRLT